MAVESKTHILDSGKQVHIYDGLVPAKLRSDIYDFIKASAFFIGWPDADHDMAIKYQCLYTHYNAENTIKAGLYPFLKTTEVNDHIKDLSLMKSTVNLSVPTHSHFSHCHAEKIGIIYYANLDWEQHWHGETLFYSEDLKEIELAVNYTPGRIVVFDSSIPHSVRPQSHAADQYRFTYLLAFE